jgi:hypothetical protein
MSEMETVKLNVGGMLYEVALDTLMRHPQTMLAKLVSEIWRGSPCARGDPIFIDRDKDLFKYILAWYRDDTMIIPRTVAIDALRNEARFFSLPDNIAVEQEKASLSDCCEGLKNFTTNFATRHEESFALWGLQQAIKEGYLKGNGKENRFSAKITDYQDLNPTLDMNAALKETKLQIKKHGFESLLSVEYKNYVDGLLFTFK